MSSSEPPGCVGKLRKLITHFIALGSFFFSLMRYFFAAPVIIFTMFFAKPRPFMMICLATLSPFEVILELGEYEASINVLKGRFREFAFLFSVVFGICYENHTIFSGILINKIPELFNA
jgi:hypothetical protein